MAFNLNGIPGSSLINHELNATMGRSLLSDLGSFASNLGFHRKVISGPNGASVTATAFGNRILNSKGVGFNWLSGSDGVWSGHSTLDAAVTSNKGAGSLGALMGKNASKTTGVFGALNKARYASGGYGLGGAFAAYTAYSSAAEEYSASGSMISSMGAGAMGLGKSLVQNKMIAVAIRNPWIFAPAAAGLGAYAVMDSYSAGNRYLRQTRLHEMNGNVSAASQSQQAYTMRQRSMMAMENSRFGAMRALGNEAMPMHMPKARYSNSNYNDSPILGY